MDINSIQKLLNHYSKPEFKNELLNAIKTFFNAPDLGPEKKLEATDREMDMFNEWFVFDFLLNNKRGLLQDFYEENPYNQKFEKLQIYKDLQENIFSTFEISKIDPEKGAYLKDLRSEKEYFVEKDLIIFKILEGDIIFTRIVKINNRYEMISNKETTLLFPPFAKKEVLKILPDTKEKLTPKTLRDMQKQFEKIGEPSEEVKKTFKKKILDDQKCLCDICKQEKKIGAFSHNRLTGEPMVFCYDCNLELLAKREGVTKEVIEERRKRMFKIGYIFQEEKSKEYLELKNKEKFDSTEEKTKIAEQILATWNTLSIEDKKALEQKDEKELKKIYKQIPVDFSNL